jgi:hypothetical protein
LAELEQFARLRAVADSVGVEEKSARQRRVAAVRRGLYGVRFENVDPGRAEDPRRLPRRAGVRFWYRPAVDFLLTDG